jgi:acyl-CoA thioesterase I
MKTGSRYTHRVGFIASHFVSGSAFFSGAAFILLAILSPTVSRSRFTTIMVTVGSFCGMMFVALSAIPLPIWLYSVWSVAVLAWLVVDNLRSVRKKWLRPAFRILAIFFTLGAIACDLPYYWAPRLPVGRENSFYLIGDSISAGIGDKEIVRWPQLIQKRYQIQVVDLSRPGATVESSLPRATNIAADHNLVLLEIGGNDVLGGTPPVDFERALDTLLRTVSLPGRVVVMLEIPLPPFCNSYGLVQRRLAHRFGIILIPRRFFTDVFTGNQTTVDGIHLSQRGQEKMANMLWKFLEPAFTGQHL